MTEPTTLREVLDSFITSACAAGTNPGPINDTYARAAGLLSRSLYGTDEPCPACDGSGLGERIDAAAAEFFHREKCLSCHGTGRLKTPGLVERLKQEVLGAAESDELPKSAGAAYGIVLAAEALRREIGEATP